jgi:hypothetical protein
VLPLYWWLTTSTSSGGSPPPAVVVAPEEAAVVVAEEAAVVAEDAVVVAEAVVMAPKHWLCVDEARRGGDVGRAHNGGHRCRCGVGRWGGTEQHCAGDGACAHCACCYAPSGRQ